MKYEFVIILLSYIHTAEVTFTIFGWYDFIWGWVESMSFYRFIELTIISGQSRAGTFIDILYYRFDDKFNFQSNHLLVRVGNCIKIGSLSKKDEETTLLGVLSAEMICEKPAACLGIKFNVKSCWSAWGRIGEFQTKSNLSSIFKSIN